MRDVTGLVLILCGAWLLWSGRTRRAAALVARAEGRALVGPSLAGFGAIVRPVVFVALGYLALKASLAYAVMDGGRIFSLLDLVGFLFLLAAYGGWLHLRTSCWEPDVPFAATSPERATTREPRSPRPRGALPGARDRAGPDSATAHARPAGTARDRAA